MPEWSRRSGGHASVRRGGARGRLARTAPDDARIVSSLRSLGDVQLQAGVYAAAVDSFDRALTLTERFAPDSPATADILVSLATSLLWGDRRKDAVKTADRAVELLDGAAVDQVRLGRAARSTGRDSSTRWSTPSCPRRLDSGGQGVRSGQRSSARNCQRAQPVG